VHAEGGKGERGTSVIVCTSDTAEKKLVGHIPSNYGQRVCVGGRRLVREQREYIKATILGWDASAWKVTQAEYLAGCCSTPSPLGRQASRSCGHMHPATLLTLLWSGNMRQGTQHATACCQPVMHSWHCHQPRTRHEMSCCSIPAPDPKTHPMPTLHSPHQLTHPPTPLPGDSLPYVLPVLAGSKHIYT
jgi:hypothetical protein